MTIKLGQRFPLGPFDLLEPIGRGAMAEVWAGVHRSTGESVAIKVLTDEATRRREWILAFRNEIRAVAGLTHPAIVHVDDFGEIPDGLTGAFGTGLRPGSPYLVMERVPGGSMRDRLGRMRWDEIRFVLMRLFDALAHAHSRGLVHRDITPGNVLGAGTVLKLADFGLCHFVAQGGGGARATTAGTPAYMAPEQWLGRWRDFGPWTDVYGVGCLAWALATGEPPFGGVVNLDDMRASHLDRGPPAFKPLMPVPPGFEDLLRQCLRKDTARRLQRAADLMWRMLELPEPEDDGSSDPEEDELATQNLAALGTMWSVVLPQAVVRDAEPLQRATITGEGPAPAGVPLRVPRSWRGPTDALERRILPGVGLRLLGFRTVPLVGRELEQNRLWQALLDVVATGEPRLVILRGPAGCGKSRLARWLSSRAHEVGAALVLRAEHDLAAGGSDPLVEMIRSLLRLRRGDSSADLKSRVARHLRSHGVEDGFEEASLRQLLHPSVGVAVAAMSGTFVGPVAPAERRAVVHRAVERVTRQRPLVLVLEDVQYGAESLRFAKEILLAEGGPPVVIVATLRDDILEGRPEEAELLAELADLSTSSSLLVGPLQREHWSDLVQGILSLEEDLAVQVEERTAGNPMFAIQLIADWVQRGILELGRSGFRLREGTRRQLPDDIHDVWADRVSDLLEGLPAGDARALELAALLGERVDGHEWADACRIFGIQPSSELVEHLLAARLARRSSGPESPDWAFAHGMLRESLERKVADRGDAAPMHKACAQMLETRGGPGSEERIGRHFLAAGETEAAVRPLLRGASERAELGDFRQAEALIARRESALERLGVVASDPRWGDGLLLVAGLEVQRNRLDRAAELADQLLDRAEQAEWSGLDGWARQILGRVACLRGELEPARIQLEAATRIAEERVEPNLFAACRAGMGMVLLLDGRLGSAREATLGARREFSSHGLANCAAAMTLQLSLIALQERAPDEAERCVTEALVEFKELGARNSIAQCRTQQGTIARFRGDHREARRCYEEALSMYRALGAGGYLAPLVKLGVLAVEAGEYLEAREMLQEAMRGLEEIGGWTSMGALQILVLPCVAAAGDWEAWDRLVPEAEVTLASAELLHEDVPRMARLGGDLAVRAGQLERARRVWLLALSQWRRLGLLPEARALASDLAELTSGLETNRDIRP